MLTCFPIQHAAFAQDQNTDEAIQSQPQTTEQEAAENSAQTVGSPIVDLIKANQTKKSQMQSIDWDNKKYKNKVAKEKESEITEEEEEEEEEDKTTQGTEEELTQEGQKIWKHYNDLARNIKQNKNDAKKADKSEKKEVQTDGAKKEDKKEDEKETKDEDKTSSSGGITEILQRYKESQKKQGPMNSRSYGSID
jgi:hypothetical protein